MTYEKRIVAGLRKYAKYLSLLALAICACTHTPENCGDGGDQLDPSRQFCRDGKALNKCGGKEYDPYAQFCATEKVYGKCNGADDYDPLREFCSGGAIYAKCGVSGTDGVTFDPQTQGCYSGIVKARCGTNFFDPNNEFCFNEIRIYDLCKGNAFDPATEGCDGEAVLPKCGANHYNLETHFCDNNVTYAKCNGNEYAPAKTFCHGGAIFAKCGEQVYDPSRQTCNGTTLVDIVGPPKCGGVEYDGTASFCYNDKDIIPKCGGQAYDPAVKTCNGGNIVDIPKYTVYFNANGGTDGMDPPKTMVADSGRSITLPGQQTMSKDGFTFWGWSTSSFGGGTGYKAGEPYTAVTATTYLYAKWIPICTITFNDNGATSGDVPEAVRADSGTRIMLPDQRTLARTTTGYTNFGGWNTISGGAGTNYSAGDSIAVTNSITLYALWTPALTIAVLPSDAGSASLLRYVARTSVDVTATAANGYIFGAWLGGATTYTSASVTITVSGNSTLTAIFFQPGTFTDDRNGKTYKTVKIGNQTWMAENLDYPVSNGGQYGMYYTWGAAKTACPSGWHLPSSGEWNALVANAGGNYAGMILKATSGWNSNGNGIDAYGFSALPGGSRGTDGGFGTAGDYGYWWSATELATYQAYNRYMGYNYDDVREYINLKEYGFAVRCVGD
jgi:uncharacterized protein (TIGR02145 family)